MLAAAIPPKGNSGGGNFLIPNGTIIFELVIFIIVLGVIAKFVLPPVQQVMNERSGKIRDDLKAGEAGNQEASQLEAERVAVLDAARTEARQLLSSATEQAAAIVAESRERAQQEYERIVLAAQPDVEAEGERVRAELAARLPGLVAEAASQVLGETVDPSGASAELNAALESARARSNS